MQETVRSLVVGISAQLTRAIWYQVRLLAGQKKLQTTLDRVEKKLDAQGLVLAQVAAEIVPRPAVTFRMIVTDAANGDVLREGKGTIDMDFRIGKKYLVAVTPVDVGGNPTTIDGPARFAASDPEAVELVPQGDLACQFTYKGAANVDHLLSISGDGDMGEGVKDISSNIEAHTIPGDAASFQTNITEVAEG